MKGKVYKITNTHPTYASEEEKQEKYKEVARQISEILRREKLKDSDKNSNK